MDLYPSKDKSWLKIMAKNTTSRLLPDVNLVAVTCAFVLYYLVFGSTRTVGHSMNRGVRGSCGSTLTICCFSCFVLDFNQKIPKDEGYASAKS